MQKKINEKFIIPYVDQGMKFWEKLSGIYKPSIKAVYFPLMDEQIGTGRPKQPERYFKVLGSYVNETPLQPHEIGGGPASLGFPMDIETDFYKSTLFCEKNCGTCSICADYWAEKVIRNG